jgi:hypothetical protein
MVVGLTITQKWLISLQDAVAYKESVMMPDGVRKMIFSIRVVVTLLDYLKIPQVTILGDLHI